VKLVHQPLLRLPHADQAQPKQHALDQHPQQRRRGHLPPEAPHNVPGQQPPQQHRWQQPRLVPALARHRAPQPVVGSVPHGLHSAPHHVVGAQIIRRHHRQQEQQRRQRLPRDVPIRPLVGSPRPLLALQLVLCCKPHGVPSRWNT
ncbi:MAG: hypothetical protein ACK56I_15435, partial [bacterium]